MTISRKLAIFFGGVIVAFGAMAVAFTLSLKWQAERYNALLDTQVHQMERARVVQVDFKKEVQEWKDILLRGHNPEDLKIYTQKFKDKESEVRAEASILKDELTDSQAKQLMEQFLDADSALSQKYAEAYQAYVSGQSDFKLADKIVRGRDRAPTDLFDAAVSRLKSVKANSLAQLQRDTNRRRNMAVVGSIALLLVVGVWGFLVVGNVLSRLGHLKKVSDRLARADVSGLAIDIRGNDEIAEFSRSMRGVHAAIEELLIAASAQSKTTAAGKGQA